MSFFSTFHLFTLGLHPSKKALVKWKSFSSSVMLCNFLFLYRAPSVVVKGPPVCSIGPIVLMFPGHICQASLVSCHSDLSNYFPIGARKIDGNKDRWIDILDGSENETCYMHCSSMTMINTTTFKGKHYTSPLELEFKRQGEVEIT